MENPAPAQGWRNRLEKIGLIIDLLMVTLVIINLSWIIFDSLFAFAGVQTLLAKAFGEGFVSWYGREIHDWFFFYDLGFVAIFVTELLMSWGYAIRNRTYSHWAAYPFVHWYDVLGCIPVGSLRALRILRVIGILVRLQRMGVIDYTQWPLFRMFHRWYDIALEELSDRIAVKILEGVQAELHQGDDLERKIVEQVLLPRKQLLIDSLTDRLDTITRDIYGDAKSEIETYIKNIVGEAIHSNMEISTIEKVPMLGQAVGKLLEHAVTDIVCQTLENAVDHMNRPQFHRVVSEVTGAILDGMAEPDAVAGGAITDAIADVLEVVKDEIRIQRWKSATDKGSVTV